MSLNIEKKETGNRVTLSLKGRLDAVSSKALEDELSGIDIKNEVILDMEELEYISSAGLRILLSTSKRLSKGGGTLIALHPSEAVTEVFDVTGFTELIQIRNYSPQLEELDHHLYPLRAIQRWMMDTHFNRAASTMMNACGFLHIDSSIDIEKVRDAINEMLKSHDIFRVRFVFDPDTSDIVQRFDGDIKEVEVEDMTAEEFEECKKNLIKPYKVIDSQLYRLRLIRSPEGQYFFVDFYHAIMDGVGTVRVMIREIEKRIKNPGASFSSSYAALIREELNKDKAEAEKGAEYFRNILNGFDPLKHLPPADEAGEISEHEFEIPIKGIDSGFFRGKHFSEQAFFMGAVILAMAKTTGQHEVIMSWIHSGRTTASQMRIMGIMLCQLPIRITLSDEEDVASLLSRVENSIKEGLDNREGIGSIYEEELQDECACFIFQKGVIGRRGETLFAGLPARVEPLPSDDEDSAAENTLDIELNAFNNGTFSLVIDYDSSMFRRSIMKAFAESVRSFIGKMQVQDKITVFS